VNPPRISILVPCYNAAPFLGATLESALAQSDAGSLEIIVVDDGSRDTSLAIAREFEPRGVRVIAQANRGASAARNTAFAASRGEFIQFLDADDLLAPGKIAAQLARAAREPAGTVFTGRWGRFTADPSRAAFHDGNPLFADLTPRDYLARYGSNDCMMHPAAWLLPRAIVESAGPWDERLSLNDDGEFFARIVAASTNVAYCPDAVSLYRSALPTSLSAQRSRNHLESAHLSLQLIVDEMTLLDDNPEMRRAAADLAQRFAYDYYPAAPHLVRDAENLARSLGGSTLRPLGGRGFAALSRIVGWKLARRLQVLGDKFPGSA
jgi:glycosyltransferase involved in cell wall biosynthesis